MEGSSFSTKVLLSYLHLYDAMPFVIVVNPLISFLSPLELSKYTVTFYSPGCCDRNILTTTGHPQGTYRYKLADPSVPQVIDLTFNASATE